MVQQYVCFKRRPKVAQLTWDDVFFNPEGDGLDFDSMDRQYLSNTITYKMRSNRINQTTDIIHLERLLRQFVDKYNWMYNVDKHELFTTFLIPKRDKGMKAVFRDVFASQKKYIKCNTSDLCKAISTALKPVCSEHSETVHGELFQKAKEEITKVLEGNGFTMEKIDLDEIISNAFRKIDAPVPQLYNALNELKGYFENDFCMNTGYCTDLPERRLYHTSAFAYVKHRSTVDALKRHQQNASRWFGKFDFKNFFGSTTLDYTMRMLEMVFPFSYMISIGYGSLLRKSLSLAFLDGGLPQGTPISPMITNLIMIPVDFELSKIFRKYNGKTFIYTRYADDILVSCRQDFDVKAVEKVIQRVVASFEAPFTIKEEKTRYGSSSGRNWNLGLMLNRENKITVGHENKRRFRAQLSNYIMDSLSGNHWDISEVQAMEGLRSYYSMVEPDNISTIIQKVNEKFNVDVMGMIKADLRR